MEQVLIGQLPDGTKAILRARAVLNHRSVEAEARAILIDALDEQPATLIDLLADLRSESGFGWEPGSTRVDVREVHF